MWLTPIFEGENTEVSPFFMLFISHVSWLKSQIWGKFSPIFEAEDYNTMGFPAEHIPWPGVTWKVPQFGGPRDNIPDLVHGYSPVELGMPLVNPLIWGAGNMGEIPYLREFPRLDGLKKRPNSQGQNPVDSPFFMVKPAFFMVKPSFFMVKPAFFHFSWSTPHFSWSNQHFSIFHGQTRVKTTIFHGKTM